MKKYLAMALATVMGVSLLASCSQPAESEVASEVASTVTSTAASTATSTAGEDEDALTVAMLIPGSVDDGGYYQAGYEGLMRIESELGANVSYISNIETELEPLSAALTELAEQGPDMVMSHGGITAEAVMAVAPNYPDIEFVLSQGEESAENVSVYQVSYDQATFLAGAAAGLLTETNVVSHISGARVTGGIKARNAFANGVSHTNPDATFLTTFTEDLNDADLAQRTAQAQIDTGSDIIFAMLNDAMIGVTDAVHENGIRQVADVYDFSSTDPDTYIISAVEDIGFGLVEAARTFQEGVYETNVVKNFGLESEGAMDVTLAGDVPQEVVDQVAELKQQIIDGEIVVSTEFDGEEFPIPVDDTSTSA